MHLNLKRFDVERGFLITLNGQPFQAMYRTTWHVMHFFRGIDNAVYWMRSEPMSEAMHRFIYSDFSTQLLGEFNETHFQIRMDGSE